MRSDSFDRLLEQALDAAAIQPVVISTEDQARAATPLAHSRRTIIKLHGDYRDSRIRNTDAELARYGPSRFQRRWRSRRSSALSRTRSGG